MAEWKQAQKILGEITVLLVLAGCVTLTEAERDKREYIRIERSRLAALAMADCERRGGYVRIERGMAPIGRLTREVGTAESWRCEY